MSRGSCLFNAIGNPDLRQSADPAGRRGGEAFRVQRRLDLGSKAYSFDCCLPTANFDASRRKEQRDDDE